MSAKKSTVKLLYEAVTKEMEIITQKSFETHKRVDGEKQKLLLAYKKLQLIKAGKSLTPEAMLALVKLSELKKPPVDVKFLDFLIQKQEPLVSDKLHLNDIGIFLSSQRQYQDLLERYNPGLNYNQSENVRKSAQRVGLEVPE